MKKYLILFCLVGPIWPGSALAMRFAADEKINLGPGQTVAEDWYAVAEEVGMNGLLLQDAFIGGVRVAIMGDVGQDLSAIGRELVLQGKVGDDLRAVGEKITLSSTVLGSALLLGRQIQVEDHAVILQDLVAMGDEVLIHGQVRGPVRLLGKQVVIQGVLTGPVTIEAETLSFAPGSRIVGSLDYRSPRPATIAPGASVQGPVHWQASTALGKTTALGFKRVLTWGVWVFRLTLFLGLMLAGLILITVLPGPSRQYALTIGQRPWASLGWGIMTLLAVPVAMLILVLTVVGIPLAMVGGGFFLGILFLARLAAAFFLGLVILRPNPGSVGRHALSFVLGFILLEAAGLIPVFGGVLTLAAILLGLGALWLARSSQSKPDQVGLAKHSTSPADMPKSIASAEPREPAAPQPRMDLDQGPGLPEGWTPSVPAFQQSVVKNQRSVKASVVGKKGRSSKTPARGKKSARSSVRPQTKKKPGQR